MLTIKGFIRIVVILFLEVDIFYANSRTCYVVYNHTICYFQPIPANISMTWNHAWNVCKENNSTLPVIENRMMAETLRKHLESKTSLGSEVWLAGRENRTVIWRWLSGKRFGSQNILRDSPFRNDDYHTNGVIIDFRFQPRYPNNTKSYICRITDSELCQNKTVVPLKNCCLFVSNDQALNLVDARNRCLDEGGDLATFEEDEDLRMLKQINSSLLQNYREYWIGLRQNWWIWNETDTCTSEEIKYSNWLKYENLVKRECLYIRLNDYTWNQAQCTDEKPFLCQSVVKTTSQTQGTDDATVSTVFLATGTLLAIIGTVIAVVIVAVIIVALVVLRKIPRNRGMNRRSDSKTTEPHEMSVHPIEKKSVKSKTIEVDDMSNYYAEIPRVADHDDNDECRDDPQPGILYAALEFDANKAIYEEQVVCSQRKKEASVPTKVGASNENGQRGSSAGSPTQAAEGTIYANL